MKKTLTMVLAFALVFALGVGGTLAWLKDSTQTITNTFTASNITITLEETKPLNQTAKMVPGATIEKDPKTTVVTGSEECFLYVKVEKSENYDKFLTFEVADGWTEVEAGTNFMVYGREIKTADIGKAFSIIKGDEVKVNTSVTKEDMTKDFTEPTLKFTAYAVQSANLPAENNTVETAWALAKAN
ncbi:MAG: hypothetical protein IJO16_07455 [Clostridia bacterium]|nr:hypothetical protein [Clostridia bacterium]